MAAESTNSTSPVVAAAAASPSARDREMYPLTSLFQKAHGRLSMLQRIDDQIATLLDQRRKVQDDLRGVQSLINEQFDRAIRVNDDAPVQFLQSQQQDPALTPRTARGKAAIERLEASVA